MLDADAIKARAREIGFDLCGIAPAGDLPELAFLEEWLSRGHAGEMAYLARTAHRRADARNLLPDARSVVALGTVYHVDRPASIEITDAEVARLARYSWGDDYHLVLGRRMNALLDWMREAAPGPFEAVAHVDTGPVQERAYARHAGLGWIGKNTCLINPELGSWLFLSAIVTDLPLEPDAPGLDQCGTCTLCIEACPTDAIVEPWVLDARRCISYLTIETRRDMPPHSRADVGSHVFGCDICQDVCPWNAPAPASGDPAWQPRDGFDRPSLVTLWRRSDADLTRLMRRSATKRAGTRRLRRNVAVAMGNSGSDACRHALAEDRAGRDDSPSVGDPMVAEHVAWARARLDG